MERTLEIGKMQRRALVNVESYNSESRTFECVFATDKPILIRSWGGEYMESLRMDGVRTERLQKGLSLLDNHDAYGSVSKNVLGIAESFRFEGGQAIATIKLSQRAIDAGIGQDISDGILRNISCGYRVYKYEEKERAEGEEIPTYFAADWEPTEISLVAIPADPNAQVRSQSNFSNKVVIMAEEKNLEAQAPVAEPQRSAAPEVDAEKIRRDAVEAERQRASQIRSAVKMAKLSDDFAEKLIADGKSIDQARALVIEEWAKQDPKPAPQVRQGADASDKIRAAIEDGLLARIGKTPEKPAPGFEDFRGMRLSRVAQTYMESQGVSTSGMTERQIAQAAIAPRQRGLHTISDFPIILGNTINRTLRAEYEYVQRTFLGWTSRQDQPDFRGVTRAQLSGLVGDFDQVLEGAEYKAGSMTDAAESYAVAKYGKVILVSWEAIMNDDLGAFTRLPRAIAAKAAQKQSDLVYAILSANANMSDGNALFSVAHGNLAGAGSAISITSLGAARQAMRNQKGLNGDYINVQPAFLICGPAKETEAQQILNATIVANQVSQANVFAGSLTLVVDPRITGNEWYLAADPRAVDTIEYGFLSGEPELFTEQYMGEDVDSLKVKARMVFGTKAIDWRGLYKNPGA